MNYSKDERVRQFLADGMAVKQEYFLILQKLREIVFENYPQVNERMMYGGILFSLDDDFGGLFVSKNHVSFEFGNGYMMKDPNKLLEGTGKYRRHLKISTLSDIEKKKVEFFVKQVQKVSQRKV